MDFSSFETQMTQLAIFWTAVEVIAFVLGMWVLYIVIKCAIRDGIKESGLVRTWATTAEKAKSDLGDLPEMRADR